ncbi:MAG: hypothetical protein ACREM2_03985 [Vulcanimicrobiaceae bacterium]
MSAEGRLAPPALAAFVAEVGSFALSGRSMRRAQVRFEAELRSGTADARAVRRYLAQVERYFRGFEREAQRRLRSVEQRLARVQQLQFNLAAERGVGAARVAALQGVLARVRELGAR